jgi:hypothetical protein
MGGGKPEDEPYLKGSPYGGAAMGPTVLPGIEMDSPLNAYQRQQGEVESDLDQRLKVRAVNDLLKGLLKEKDFKGGPQYNPKKGLPSMQEFNPVAQVGDTTEQLNALISRADDAIANTKRENELDEAFSKRALEIPPILKKLPGQYQDYYPTRHEEVPVKREGGRRYFDPRSLGEYPIMAQDTSFFQQQMSAVPTNVVDPTGWLKDTDELGKNATPKKLTPEDLDRFHREQEQLNEMNRKFFMNENNGGSVAMVLQRLIMGG